MLLNKEIQDINKIDPKAKCAFMHTVKSRRILKRHILNIILKLFH